MSRKAQVRTRQVIGHFACSEPARSVPRVVAEGRGLRGDRAFKGSCKGSFNGVSGPACGPACGAACGAAGGKICGGEAVPVAVSSCGPPGPCFAPTLQTQKECPPPYDPCQPVDTCYCKIWTCCWVLKSKSCEPSHSGSFESSCWCKRWEARWYECDIPPCGLRPFIRRECGMDEVPEIIQSESDIGLGGEGSDQPGETDSE